MTERVKNLTFSGTFSDDRTISSIQFYDQGKLFLGVLGCEYSIPYFEHLNGSAFTCDIKALHAAHKIPPEILHYSYLNRTQDRDEFAYSDAILPVYLRFQPDLESPLNDAAQQRQIGKDYMAQNLIIDQPTVQVEGLEQVVSASGATSFVSRVIDFTIPINPPPRRIVRLSLQDGLIVYLGKVR